MNSFRFNKFQILEKSIVLELFTAFDNSVKILDFAPIHIGMTNTNYAVTAENGKYLLRIYTDSNDCVEIGFYENLCINKPKLYFYDGGKLRFPYSYAIFEYINGINLNDFILSNKSFPCETAFQAGRICAEIHEKKYEFDALLKNDLTVKEQIPQTSQRILHLLKGAAGEHLKEETRHNLTDFIAGNKTLFDRIEQESVLCHGDLGFFNILIGKDKMYFIDFEYAYSGSRYHDIGHFFRRKSDEIEPLITDEIHSAFAAGYNSVAEVPLPGDWLKLARFCDIPPLLCLINCKEPQKEWIADIEYDILYAVKED